MKSNGLRSVTHLSWLPALPVWAAYRAEPADPTCEQYLRESAVPKETIDRFLQGPSWAQYDPELGYILGNYRASDGMDKSATISTVQSNGARTSFVYAGNPCRINTYGDSFTQCHQVSDAETSQGTCLVVTFQAQTRKSAPGMAARCCSWRASRRHARPWPIGRPSRKPRA